MFGAYSAPEAAGRYETVTFSSEAAAASAPAHDAALNDLSSTPPVSSAKHAFVAVDDALSAVSELEHPESTRALATVVAARMATSFEFFNFPPSCMKRGLSQVLLPK
jgi:hypothetical protein